MACIFNRFSALFLRASYFPVALFFTLTVLLASQTVMAAGNHEGGHGHDQTTGIGRPGSATEVMRTIAIAMSDNMRFTPASVAVAQGETIRFAVSNTGKLVHEFNLGTEQQQKEHYELMKKFPGMVHDEPNSVSLPPGEQGEVIWQFTEAGEVGFACLHPGHYEAGMKGSVQVAANVAETAQDLIWAEGEVRKVDPQTGKITIKHGPLVQLDMPPMTMVFTVNDKTLLNNLKVGDSVSFQVVSESGGRLVVTDIKPAGGDHSSHH